MGKHSPPLVDSIWPDLALSAAAAGTGFVGLLIVF
jgi:hypothetical protein